jgi:flagellar basal-body rod protein FlgB
MTNKIANFMFEKTGIEKVGKYLDVSSLRQKLVAGNLANISTPGYRAKDIDFQSEFDRVSGQSNHLIGYTTHRNHIPLGSHPASDPEIAEAVLVEGDMNAVDPEHEISNLAKNELIYSIGARLLHKKVTGLRNAITSK